MMSDTDSQLLNRVGVHSSKAKNARLFLSIVGMKQRIPSTVVWFDVKSRSAKQSFKVFSMIETGISPPVEASSLPEILPVIENNAEINAEIVQITPQSLERFETIPWLTLDPRWQELERIRWWILTGIVGTILGIGWLLTWVIRGTFDAAQWVSLAFVALVFIVGFLASRYFPSKQFRATSWQLKSNGLEIRHGIWWRHRIFVPCDRIQHTDVQQGPLMRIYGLASLIINTGGTHEPSIPLSGLSMSTAEQTRVKLSARAFNTSKKTPVTMDVQG